MTRKMICALASLPMLLLAGTAFGAELKPYPGPEAGPTVVLIVNTKCDADCAAIETKVKQVADRFTNVAFRKGADASVSSICLSVTAGPGMLLSMKCDLTDGADIASLVESQANFALQAEPLAVKWENAKKMAEVARKPFYAEADVLRAQMDAALAPLQEKFEATLAPISKARHELDERESAAVRAELGFDRTTMRWRDLSPADQAKVLKVQAQFAQEQGRLMQLQVDSLKPVGKEIDDARAPFEAKFRELEKRMNAATHAESQAAVDAMKALTEAITANKK